MSTFYCDPIMYVPINQAGRDLIVGDIHGAYDLVIEALKAAKFNPAVDRLFVVGDLVDRGRGSHRVLNFLAKPWVYSIRGNHEDMLIDLYKDDVDPPEDLLHMLVQRFPGNGMHWWLDVEPETRRQIITELRKLPLIMEVATPRGPFGIVHAEVPLGMSWQDFKASVAKQDERVVAEALWGRKRLERDIEQAVPGIGRIFVGHTIQTTGMRQLANVFAIDTGAVKAEADVEWPGDQQARLTMLNAAMSTTLLRGWKPSEGKVDVRDGEVPGWEFGKS
ncbi:serine/threonine protein phosphatase 1 [Pseudomonas nitritireducens]|uniref:Serine/threonine protein phosphatase 1 n=1 Tax=Pseudomonas nitroreducens TaxID=46680 RepID=A0A7W7NYA2_PSENT|nr:metallophosphoesterase [Pseudomonas nitritireducens]MBB4861246.1 serine/threonine protein phosphatase 1 [Pseudomonas nitritireducens]